MANAKNHTAQVTRQVIGVELPWSVFANFAFAAFWLVDAIREFRLRDVHLLGAVRHGIWLLMMLNGTVVFGPKYWTWIAVPCAVAFVTLKWRWLSRAGAGR